MTATETIRAELVGIGLTENAANNLMRYAISRFVHQLADDHNGGHGRYPTDSVWDAPTEETVEQVPDGLKAAACLIMLALVQVGRTASLGNCNPEVTLPMRYAAEMVLFAARSVARKEQHDDRERR